MAACKNRVAVSLRDSIVQEIALSTDSGLTFQRTGDGWPVHDSSLLLAFGQDSSTVLSLESTGILRTWLTGSNHISVDRLDSRLSGDSAIYGFVLVPGTDSIYVFGGFQGLIALDWTDPSRQIHMAIPQQWRVYRFLDSFNEIYKHFVTSPGFDIGNPFVAGPKEADQWRVTSIAISPSRDIFCIARNAYGQKFACYGRFLPPELAQQPDVLPTNGMVGTYDSTRKPLDTGFRKVDTSLNK